MIYRLIRWWLVTLIAIAIVLILGRLAQSNRQARLATGDALVIAAAADSTASPRMDARKP